MEWVIQHLGKKLISRRTPIPWPARSPDLTPLDFVLCGYLKDRVYEKNRVGGRGGRRDREGGIWSKEKIKNCHRMY